MFKNIGYEKIQQIPELKDLYEKLIESVNKNPLTYHNEYYNLINELKNVLQKERENQIFFIYNVYPIIYKTFKYINKKILKILKNNHKNSVSYLNSNFSSNLDTSKNIFSCIVKDDMIIFRDYYTKEKNNKICLNRDYNIYRILRVDEFLFKIDLLDTFVSERKHRS